MKVLEECLSCAKALDPAVARQYFDMLGPFGGMTELALDSSVSDMLKCCPTIS